MSHREAVRPAGRHWSACLLGAYGLSVTVQVTFLVALRARELGAGFDVIGLIVGSGAAAAAASSIPAGAMVDRWGPHRSFVVGALATGVVSACFIAAPTLWVLALLQPLHGMCRNLAWVASQGVVTSLAGEEQRARLTGRFGMFSGLGSMAGPFIAGFAAASLGIRLAFVLPAAYSCVFALVALRSAAVAPRPATARGRKPQGAGFRGAAQLGRLAPVQVALMMTFARLWISYSFSTSSRSSSWSGASPRDSPARPSPSAVSRLRSWHPASRTGSGERHLRR